MRLVLKRLNLLDQNTCANDSLNIGASPTDAQLRRWYRALLDYHGEMERLGRIVMLYPEMDGYGLSVASLPEEVEFAVDVPIEGAPDV